ncbi:MAG TPA: Lrp/AsnC family transcriptional regulator [Candidatus Lokiarchaeia archaeon]
MIKIDIKDKKILYELDKNSRQSLSNIGKKVGLHKNVVLYRIKRLKKAGVIKNFYTVIDSFKLGYNCFRVYLVFQQTTPEKKKEIIDYFVKNKYTWWVGTFEGDYNLAVVMWVKELNDFHVFWEETLKKYRQYFLNQIFCNYVQLHLFRNSFIVDKFPKSDREIYKITGGGKKVKTDILDFKILELLAKDAKIPTVNIVKKLDSTIDTVKSRIKKLIEQDIIQGFRVNIDFSKFGYQFYKVNINLVNYNDRRRIISYIKNNPHLEMIDKSIGYYDLELDFWLKNLKQFHQIMDDLTLKFPDSIKNYSYVHDPQLHKMLYLPEEY